MSEDLYKRNLNCLMFGAAPSKEVEAQDDWDYVVVKGKAAGHYWRGHLWVAKTHITIRQDTAKWVPNKVAISELRQLMARWRRRGWNDFVDFVEVQDSEDEESYPVYELLGKSVARRKYIKIPLHRVKFFKELPRDPSSGLAAIAEPRRNGRITGLTATGIFD